MGFKRRNNSFNSSLSSSRMEVDDFDCEWHSDSEFDVEPEDCVYCDSLVQMKKLAKRRF